MSLNVNSSLNQNKTIGFKNNDEMLLQIANTSDRDLQRLARHEAIERRLEDPSLKWSRKATNLYPAADVLLTAATTDGSLTDKLTSGAARTVFWYLYNKVGKGVSKLLGNIEEKPKVQKIKQDHPAAYEIAKVGGLIGLFTGSIYAIDAIIRKTPELIGKLATKISPEGTQSIKDGFKSFAETINGTSGAQGTNKLLEKIGKAAPFVYTAALVGFTALIVHNIIENIKTNKRTKQNLQNLQDLRQEARNTLSAINKAD